MSAPETGGPAFPGIEQTEEWSENNHGYITKLHTEGGMTLRDYFAAKAMQGLLVGMNIFDSRNIAEQDYVMADAMLRVRGAAK